MVKFDDLRFKLKEAKKAGQHTHMATSVASYSQLATNLRIKVQFIQAGLSDELKQVENKHFQEHGTLPPKITGSHYSKTLKERNLATAILPNM